FAAGHPERLRTLTLTNGDTHDNWPPEAVKPIIEAARSGALTEAARLMLADPGFARSPAGLGVGYADPSAPTDEAIRVYLEPLVATPERIENSRRYWLSFDCAQTVAIEPALRRLRVPTLVVWGLADAATVAALVDLTIALSLVTLWMWQDARERGIGVVPYVILTLTLGSIGPLCYLIRRESTAPARALGAAARAS